MSYGKFFLIIVKWAAIGIIMVVLFDIIWACVFWQNNSLFYYHWLSLPLGIMTAGLGSIIEFIREDGF